MVTVIVYGAMHGKSFYSVLSGKSDTHRDAAISGFYGGFDRCSRNNKWSYIERPENQPAELYNLESDPCEKNNVIDEYHKEAVLL